ncbi:DUF3071 domain-containing protein [Alloscardovia theropitheci]|uniref:DUF3071 domain-containing protein n=1 Tax=Alloscardovia theropitheci TaxID=2496842 RepID=A0A4V2MUE0_9BIFI|nr:septation protein SepH [Alloscardovia theropitheci]TCD54829.1 DUF3071 domain-containing protein [Alloscardovia theropitheci]
MADNSSSLLSFTHTDDNGNLILRDPLTHATYALEVSDELEQGIIAAKQIKRDLEGAPLPHTEKVLPLSQIQALVRAGHTPEDISHDYGVAVALVRRFAAPVETEKKFAISQFLDTTLNNDDSPIKVKEVITSSMASLAGDYSSIEWNVTRDGNSPWRIQATYDTARSRETAEWMFTPREHSVVCVNLPAKRLLGEISTVTSPVDKELFSTDAVPVITANIPAPSDAVSMTTGSFDSVSMNSMRSNSHMSTGAFSAIVNGSSAPAESIEPDVFEPHIKRSHHTPTAHTSTAQAPSEESSATSPTVNGENGKSTNTHEFSQDSHTSEVITASQDSLDLGDIDTDKTAPVDTSEDSAKLTSPSQLPKRKRSAIPAWDDILFGSRSDD